jgi:multidrug resistance efflux pump
VKRIKPLNTSYQLAYAPRNSAINFGKWLYLSLLIVFSVIFFHILFSNFYLLKGEGFIFSDNRAIALEFDATVSQLFVKEGDRVLAKQPLFQFDGFQVRQNLAQLSLDVSQLEKDLLQNQIALNESRAQYQSTKDYVAFTSNLQNALTDLEKKRFVAKTEVAQNTRRHFEAVQKMHQYEASIPQLEIATQQFQRQLDNSHAQLTALEQQFNQGEVVAPVEGIVTQLNFTPGTMLQKGQNALQIFYGQPYLYTYFEKSSWVSYKIGDKVLVKLPGHRGYQIGKVVKRLPLAQPLPAEFQPKFKPALRNQLAVIEMPAEILENTPLLSTAEVRKPLGFGLISWLL